MMGATPTDFCSRFFAIRGRRRYGPIGGIFLAVLVCGSAAKAQSTINADGNGNTYEAFAAHWGVQPYEVPDCSDVSFGRHITDEFDTSLNKYVFIFHLHLTPDNDRCLSDDRQRTE